MAAHTTTVLVADDDLISRKLLVKCITLLGHNVAQACNGQEALDLFVSTNPDLVILDITMPIIDGFAACAAIRDISPVPIILLTARDGETDKIRGLDQGADDYVTKPFSMNELQARVRAALRRESHALPNTTTIFGDFIVVLSQHTVTLNGHALHLTPIEFRLLACLVTHGERVLMHDYLLTQVWGEQYRHDARLLHVAINRLRRKIEDESSQLRYLHTHTGIGYVLQPTPR